MLLTLLCHFFYNKLQPNIARNITFVTTNYKSIWPHCAVVFLPLVSKGMRSHCPGLSGGHLNTAPPLMTSGCPESAVGAPTNSLKRKIMKS